MTVDVTGCDVEPIHIPGAIQPHGVLVAVDTSSWRIREISANCAEFLGIAAEAMVGRSLGDLLGPAADALIARPAIAAGAPTRFEANGAQLEAMTHRHRGVLLVEIERHEPGASSGDAALRTALASLQRSNSVRELCAIAVDAVRTLTGFDRVMLYRFGEDGHGDVLEEAISPGFASYRGHRFPASDIPRQARALYLLNWLRLIPSSTYVPVGLVGDPKATRGDALDMSFATLRSVSPGHLEYLRNMGVAASMSVSLIATNTLWGLIACHHRTPRHISFAARAACEVVGRVIALQIASREELDARTARAALRGIEAKLADAMRSATDGVALALALRGEALLEVAGATGAAICTADQVFMFGATPTQAEIVALAGWLGPHDTGGIVDTDVLSTRFAPASDYAHLASGLLAISLPNRTPSYVMWFRPELVQTVTWAGDPTKPVAIDESDERLHPRRSFDAWTEVVRGRSEPWRSAEIEAVSELRRRAIEIDLTHQIGRAEEAVRMRDEIVAVVSHDLKGPLQILSMINDLIRPELEGNDGAVANIARANRAIDRMSTLIHDLLDLATIESGRFDVTRVACKANQLLADAASFLVPLANRKGVELTWRCEADPWVEADPERVFQVMSNLVGNAIKFTPSGRTVDVSARPVGDVVRFAVADTGPGIDPLELPHVFDRYWQSRRARSAGSGLGLYIAKGIVEAHGQQLWAESAFGVGATFYFDLPVATTPRSAAA